MRRALAAALLLALAAPAPSQQVLNLRDADIRAFIQDAAKVTGRTFIIDPRVQGKVSVVTDRPLSRTEYLAVFLSTLRANGLVAVPTGGGAFRVQPVEGAAASAGRVGAGSAGANAFVTEVFRLRSIDATSAAETLRPLVSKDGSVTANRAGNAIVVADYADNIRRIRELLTRIDRDTAATRVIALRNASAREIATSLQALVGAGAAGGQGVAGPSVSVVAIESANAVALRGDPTTVARLSSIAEDLDRRAATGTVIRVVFLEHADAEKLLPVLQQLVGQAVTLPSTPAPSLANAIGTNVATPTGSTISVPTPGVTAPAPAQIAAVPQTSGANGHPQAVIARFEGANALVIAAPPDMQRTLADVIRQLDSRREQVLVEAIIVEIGDTAARQLGVQFLLGSLHGGSIPFAATNYSNTAPNILTIAGALASRKLNQTTTTVNGTTTVTTSSNAVSDQLAQAAVSSILGAGGGFGGVATKVGSGVFGAIVNALQSDTDSNILSTPSIMTLDNQEAKILVGQEIPITTGQALSQNFDNQFRTVQRENVGIQLEVKPQINAGGAIKLAIKQEVSSIAGPVANDNSELILNKRQIETTVTVDDGQIIALGGLLDDNERRTIERIPGLSSLPVVGELFKSRSRSRTKTNLMVFIRPTIIRSADDARDVAGQRYDYIVGQQIGARPDAEPSIDEMVREYMGAEPPVARTLPPAPQPPPGAPKPPEIITPTMSESSVAVQPLDPPRPKAKRR